MDLDGLLAALADEPWNAVVGLDPEHVRAQRPPDGPLAGLPVAVKDLIDVAGLPTRCGSRVLAAAPPAARDAPVVAALRAAGALIVAKTHCHEFAYGPTGDIAAEGPCHNPHDHALITGGSSSGSAAAVAAGLVPVALGTDTGCSVRTPAALCGVIGFKPGRGVLPTDGVFPLSETCDHIGLIGADLATVVRTYTALSGRIVDLDLPVTGLTVGVPTDSYWCTHDSAIADGVARAVDLLAAAGARTVEMELPGIDDLAATYRPIVGAEAYATHARWLVERPQDYQQLTRERLLAAADQSATVYVDAQRTRRRIAGEWQAHLAEVDLLALPTTPIRASPIGAQHVVVENGSTVEVRGALLSLTLPFSLVGLPAISVPAPDVSGLPAGVQLVGIRDEHALLAAAAQIR